MNDQFDAAAAEFGLAPFGDNDLINFILQRDDRSEIVVNLFRDREESKLCISAHTSNTVPRFISREFFNRFARAALEPLRGNAGIGMSEGSDYICIYDALPMADYLPGNSVIVLENIVGLVEEWDAELLSMV